MTNGGSRVKAVMKIAPVLLAGILSASAAEPNLPADEFVYEGKTAAAWVQSLRAGENAEKASHALLKLGKDAVPPLMQLIKEKDPKLAPVALKILAEMKQEKEAIPTFTALLKNEDFEVRRTAIKCLAEFAGTNLVAQRAIEEMLNDRDKAVAEAAELALEPLVKRQKSAEPIAKAAAESLNHREYERASDLADRALMIDPKNATALEVLGAVKVRMMEFKKVEAEKMKALDGERQRDDRRVLVSTLIKNAKNALEAEDFAKALELARKALAIDPQNDGALVVMNQANAKLGRAEEDLKARDGKAKDPFRQEKRGGEGNDF